MSLQGVSWVEREERESQSADLPHGWPGQTCLINNNPSNISDSLTPRCQYLEMNWIDYGSKGRRFIRNIYCQLNIFLPKFHQNCLSILTTSPILWSDCVPDWPSLVQNDHWNHQHWSDAKFGASHEQLSHSPLACVGGAEHGRLGTERVKIDVKMGSLICTLRDITHSEQWTWEHSE